MAGALIVTLSMLLALMATRAEALKCWKCDSSHQPGCGNPFNNRTISLMDCGNSGLHDQPQYCSKFKSDVNGRTVYYRSCSHTEGLCPDAPTSGMCTTCEMDGCNGAPDPRLLPAVLLTAATSLAVLRAVL